MFEDVGSAFKKHGGYDVNETPEADHGRMETRKMQHTSFLPACQFLSEENPASWKTLKTHIRPEAKGEEQGKATQAVRYYIRDEQETKAAYFCSLVRGHRSMENRLYQHLDVTINLN